MNSQFLIVDCHLADCHLADRHLAECYMADCHLADCHLADCHLADCDCAEQMQLFCRVRTIYDFRCITVFLARIARSGNRTLNFFPPIIIEINTYNGQKAGLFYLCFDQKGSAYARHNYCHIEKRWAYLKRIYQSFKNCAKYVLKIFRYILINQCQ